MNATCIPVGELNDWFTREVGSYMWAHIAFDKTSWKYVSKAEQNALNEHLKQLFNFDEVEQDLEADRKKGGIATAIMNRYRGRKAYAKKHFDENGGKADTARARANPPPQGMTEELWGKAVDFFLSDAHEARSIANKAVRKQQKYVNRGDTSSYSSFCHKHNKKRLDAFYNAHTSKDGTFDSPLAEQQYDDLKAALESQTGVNDEGEYEESSASHPDEMEVFESVLGERRGHRRGIGPKSSSSDSMSFVGHHGQVQAPQSLTQDQIANLFQDPSFKDQLNQYLASNNYLKKNDKDHATDEDDE